MSFPDSPSPINDILSDPELNDFISYQPPRAQASTETARIISQFQEINAFIDKHGVFPGDTSDGRELEEFLEDELSIRLDTLRQSEDLRALLQPYDRHKVLDDAAELSIPISINDILDDPILHDPRAEAIFDLVNVSDKWVGRESPDEIAERTRCETFEEFRPMFDTIRSGLLSGTHGTISEKRTRDGKTTTAMAKGDITEGTAFILNGVMAYVAKRFDEERRTKAQYIDARLHIVFENGTEAKNYLLRSFVRALWEDENGRRIMPSSASVSSLPIFGGELQLGEEDQVTGTLYIVESASGDPQIVALRGRLYKIGFTKQSLSQRLQNAEADPTFLCASVREVASYTVANVRPRYIEKLIHEFFRPARLQITVHLGREVDATEWFVVPLELIREACPRIVDGSIRNYRYDRLSQKIVAR